MAPGTAVRSPFILVLAVVLLAGGFLLAPHLAAAVHAGSAAGPGAAAALGDHLAAGLLLSTIVGVGAAWVAAGIARAMGPSQSSTR